MSDISEAIISKSSPDDNIKLIPLRSDLEIMQSGRGKQGERIWSILDPVQNKFYRISWLEFEIISNWHLSDPKRILKSVSHRTTLKPTGEDISRIYQFLLKHQLLEASSKEMVEQLLQYKYGQIKGFNWVLKNYLFLRIPLIKPDRFLKKAAAKMSWLFTKQFVFIMLSLMVIGLFLVFREFQSFVASFSIIKSPIGALMVVGVLIIAKIIHEMGHGIACRHYGCKVPNMGVALIVLWPILWTDTTDAWRLTDNKKRLIIDSAGMFAELSLAIISSILWALSPEGDFKTAMHLLAGTTWIMTLLVNLNPFMRFDGYYITSDLFNIPNLQNRSFLLARQFIRKKLLGIPPLDTENFSQKERFWLISYAIGTWIYRFFLFLGIALLVYHFFFKALGIFLMIVEVWWFIIRPIIDELKQWPELIKAMPVKKNLQATSFIIFISLMLLIIPFRQELTIPAMLKSSIEIPVLSSVAGLLESTHVKSGDKVEKGQLLFIFKSPDIEHKKNGIKVKIKQEEKEYSQARINSIHYSQATLLKESLKKNNSHLNAINEEAKLLKIYAPEDGYIYDIPDDLIAGNWVSPREFLGIFSNGIPQISAYIKERDIERIIPNSKGVFYLKNHHKKSLDIVLHNIGEKSIRNLNDLDLASIYGGEIEVKQGKDNLLIPVTSMYNLIFKLNDEKDKNNHYDQRLSGYINLDVKSESFLGHIYKKTVAIFIRELSW